MNKVNYIKKIVCWWGMFALIINVSSCVDSRTFEDNEANCLTKSQTNTTFSLVKDLYSEGVYLIQEDLTIEGYVISSDENDNFFGTIHLQERQSSSSEGFEIHVDLRDSHLFYPVGSKVQIHLNGLYLGKSKGVFVLGGVFTSFGNLSIGRLPVYKVYEHLNLLCDENTEVKPTVLSIDEISDEHINTLIQLKDVEFDLNDVGKTFAENKEETIRTLVNCTNGRISLLNSGYADFQNEILPEGNGSVTGVLHKNNDDFYLIIRNAADISFNTQRCTMPKIPVTSNRVLISELADPDNNANARFIELYNSSDSVIHLYGWKLNRYTNDNVEISSTVDLSEYSIEGKSTIILASDTDEFASVYGFLPDVNAGKNSPADSNGDDNFQLIDSFGVVIDVFGIVGEDGTGTNHEFEDGRALRKEEIQHGIQTYNVSEWVIYNDSGGANTLNLPQIAPQNYTPGQHFN